MTKIYKAFICLQPRQILSEVDGQSLSTIVLLLFPLQTERLKYFIRYKTKIDLNNSISL